MVNSLRLFAVPALICAAPCCAAEFSSQPLSQQTEASLHAAAAAAVKDGAWQEWTEWLGGLLRAELSQPAFQPDAGNFTTFMAQPQAALALAQWRLLTVTGAGNFREIAEKNGGGFLTWLFSTPGALHAYLGSGPMDKEGTSRGLEIWRDIFLADPKSREGLWMRVAAATALAHTEPVKSLADGGDIDPLKRYQYFRNAHASSMLAPSFDSAATWELRFVVNSWARDEELAWVLGAMDPKNKCQEKVGDACGMVPYRLENSRGVSVQNGPEYYDHKPVTLERMHTVGGVCGAISKFGTAAAQAYGVPAMPVGQPGHCAFLWKKDPVTWRTGNDIEGWPGSSEHGGIHIHWGNRGSYVLLMEEAHRDPAGFLASEQAVWASALAGPNAAPLLLAAVRIQPLNAGAWQALTKNLMEDKSTALTVFQSTARDLLQALPNHPLPLIDLLAPLEAGLGFTGASSRRDYITGVCTAIAGGSPGAQQGCGQAAQAEIIRRHAAALLPEGERTLAVMLQENPAGGTAAVTDEQRTMVLELVEAAVEASRGRSDLQDALTGRYLGLMSGNPGSLARAIQFFGGLFETAKTNSDRKPAIALARRLILLAAKAGDLEAMEKYSAECRRLLRNS